MDGHTRKKLIDQYKDGYRVVAEALAGATDEELDTPPAPGKWTAREIAHHLGDSEMTAAVRLRLLIATPRPQIMGYDQDEFARRLHYDKRPIEASLDAFNAARRSTAEILDRMTEAEWLGEGTHSEAGRYTAERWLQIYAAHAHAHADQIRVARDAGKRRKS
jgi:DinB superfamily